MPLLFTRISGERVRIYGPGEDEGSGPWSCTCSRGTQHQGKRVNGEKPDLCPHLFELFESASRGELNRRYKPTREGDWRADNCKCSPRKGTEAQELARLPPPEPPPAPVPGKPSRNKPCPCGSGEIYKWCSGPPGAPHPRGAWEPAPEVQLEPEEPRKGQRRPSAPLPVETAEERGERLRARKIERAEEKSAAEKRLDEIFERVRAEDLLRQKAKRARRAKK